MLQPLLGTTGTRTSPGGRAEGKGGWGGGCDVLLREELDTGVTDRGNKWACWQTASVAPWGRRGSSAPLDNEVTKSEEITSAAAMRNFSLCQPCEMLHARPDRKIYEPFPAWVWAYIRPQPYISPLFLLDVTYLTYLEHLFYSVWIRMGLCEVHDGAWVHINGRVPEHLSLGQRISSKHTLY